MKRIAKIAGLAAVAVLAMGAGKPSSNWLATITVTPSGSHVLGNPNAKVKLAEYVSYTCSHCGSFHKEADAALKLGYVQPGMVSLEIRHVIRDPVDLAVALLTNCGNPKNFFLRHNDFMASQDKWMAKLGSVGQAQQQRWYTGSIGSRMQAVASDFGFYRIMEKRGFSTSATNKCLADKAKAGAITGQTVKASEDGVDATPSFSINGAVLTGTHSWEDLQPKIAARF